MTGFNKVRKLQNGAPHWAIFPSFLSNGMQYCYCSTAKRLCVQRSYDAFLGCDGCLFALLLYSIRYPRVVLTDLQKISGSLA